MGQCLRFTQWQKKDYISYIEHEYNFVGGKAKQKQKNKYTKMLTKTVWRYWDSKRFIFMLLQNFYNEYI